MREQTAVEVRLLNSTQELLQMIKEIDTISSDDKIANLSEYSVFDRFKKTSLALNEEARASIIERFGITGVSLDNIEQLYNPIHSGFGSIHETRSFLI